LIEVLIVIAIISLIVSITIPAVQSARESARRTECQNNLRQFGLAFANHEAAKKFFPAGTKIWVKGPVLDSDKSAWAFHSFMPDLLPYLDQQPVADRYDRRKMFSAAENADAIATVLDVAICPSTPRQSLHHEEHFQPSLMIPRLIRDQEAFQGVMADIESKYAGDYRAAVSDYAGVTIVRSRFASAAGVNQNEMHDYGIDGMFPYPTIDIQTVMSYWRTLMSDKELTIGHTTKLTEIVDGLSNTVLLIENAGRPQLWERGRMSPELETLSGGWANPQTIIEYDGDVNCPVNCANNDAVYSFHPDLSHLLFADGHLQTVSAGGIDTKVLIAMLTPNWGGTVELESGND
jgi:type II secretory pathway pseudopilin PulG